MHDLKFLRDNPEEFDAQMARRNISSSVSALSNEARAALAAQQMLESLKTEQNRLAGEVGRAKAKGSPVDDLLAQSGDLVLKVDDAQYRAKILAAKVRHGLSLLPNILDPSVPAGLSEDDNVELHRWPDAPVAQSGVEHDALGVFHGMDFDGGSKLSGSRFTVLRGGMARMARALGQYMLDLHTAQHGYLEVSPPVIVREEALYGTGQFPKFMEDVFPVGEGAWLAPTSEVMLTNLVAGNMLDITELPIRMTALTDCFRAEAGSAGRDTRGIIRQHQFQKVEMVSIVEPDQSEQEHERMTSCAEAVLEGLGLPFRRVLLCAGDTGFSARKTYDLEVWMAGAGRYREISSCSNCGDFQARRMDTRIKLDKKTKVFAHTLNGSGVAIGRALAAIVENYQDGRDIVIPFALRPYMGNETRLTSSEG